jgi:hypothetical protein
MGLLKRLRLYADYHEATYNARAKEAFRQDLQDLHDHFILEFKNQSSCQPSTGGQALSDKPVLLFSYMLDQETFGHGLLQIS